MNKAQLEAAASVNQGLKRNFNELVDQEKKHLKKVNAKALAVIAEKKSEVDLRVRIAERQRQIVKALIQRLLMNELEYLVVGDQDLTYDEALYRLQSLIAFCREHEGHVSLLRERRSTRRSASPVRDQTPYLLILAPRMNPVSPLRQVEIAGGGTLGGQGSIDAG